MYYTTLIRIRAHEPDSALPGGRSATMAAGSGGRGPALLRTLIFGVLSTPKHLV